jgi:hypothetical protein
MPAVGRDHSHHEETAMFRSGTAAALLGSLALASVGTTQPPKADDPTADKQVVKSTPVKSVPAASVKFRKDLNLPYASLTTLGSRIDAARRAGDPVTLAHAASELNVAEKVSEKTTTLTSRQVLREAAELAGLRRQVAEMRAVLHVSDQVTLEQEQIAALKQQIALNQAEQRKLDAGEEPLWTPRKIVVNNYTPQYVDVQINGYLKGQVLPGSSHVFVVEQRWNPIVLKGWGDEDTTVWGPVVLQGKFATYTWNVQGDNAIPNRP